MLDEDFDYLLKKDLTGNASPNEIALLQEQPLHWREALREKLVGITQYQHTLKTQLAMMEGYVQEKNDGETWNRYHQFQQKQERTIRKLGTKINAINSRLQLVRGILREQTLVQRGRR